MHIPSKRLTFGRQRTCGSSIAQSSEVGGWLLIADDHSGDRPHPPAIPKFWPTGDGAQLFLLITSASKSQILANPHKTKIFKKYT